MVGMNDLMAQGKEQMGKSIDIQGLMFQKAIIKHVAGTSAKISLAGITWCEANMGSAIAIMRLSLRS